MYVLALRILQLKQSTYRGFFMKFTTTLVTILQSDYSTVVTAVYLKKKTMLE